MQRREGQRGGGRVQGSALARQNTPCLVPATFYHSPISPYSSPAPTLRQPIGGGGRVGQGEFASRGGQG